MAEIAKSGEKFSVDGILGRLRAEGLRITPGRSRILEVLFSAKEPLSLEQITKRAARAGRGPDFATVFRTLALLEELRLVHKVNLQRSSAFYELHNPERHYDHVVCTHCGRVVLISEPCPLAKVEATIASRYGFRDLTHSLEFFGRCDKC